MPVRRLGPDEWRIARRARLRALQEAPGAFASTYEEEVRRPGEWWVEGMRKLTWFVAEEDGELAGVVAGLPSTDHPEIVSMWVEPAARGTGVADELLQSVIAWAEQEGADGICLAVAEGNDRARRFYERAGFVPSGPGEPLRSRPDVCTTEMRLQLPRRSVSEDQD